ncbi:MAG: hypothetical protein WC655_10380 [Candidatus Hydrogenedentales bacterium]|jgi:hypothetical protein
MGENLQYLKITGGGYCNPDTMDSIPLLAEGGLYWDGAATTARMVIENLAARAEEPPHVFTDPPYTNAATWLNRMIDVIETLPDGECRTALEAALPDLMRAFGTLACGMHLEYEEIDRLSNHVEALKEVSNATDDWSGEKAGAPAEGWSVWIDELTANRSLAGKSDSLIVSRRFPGSAKFQQET